MQQTEIAGVQRGEPMTRDKADQQKPNPDFMAGVGYRENCTACTVAYEARLRGFDVEAQSKEGNAKMDELSVSPNMAWIDTKTGKAPDFVTSGGALTADELKKHLEQEVEPGGRYVFGFDWRSRYGAKHIVSVDRNTEGLLRLYDPQSGRTYTGAGLDAYLKDIKLFDGTGSDTRPAPAKLLRVDDKPFNLDIVNHVLRKARL
jgi:hypothetical protein